MVMRRGATLQEQEDGIIYARYSSHAQKDASIEQQIRECMAFAQAQGIRIVEVYADRAVSGKTDRRPDFQRMMRDAEKGKFRYVVAWKSNRMGRNMLQAMMNEAKLNDMGIRVLYTEEDFDNTAAGRFALRSMMNVNQFYSENMAEDIRRGLNDNALQCKVNGSLPLGFVRGEDGRYALDEPKAAIVQEIFIRVACMEPFVDIANDLNARGIKTSRGKPWGKNSFHALVTNERYLGVYIYDDIRVEGGIPRIISDELFYKVQEVLKTKKNPQGRPRSYGEYLLTGKLYCGHCKSPMVGISGTARSGALHYYYSCQRHRLEKSCDKRNVRRDVIEEAVARAIQGYALRPDIIEWIADSTVEYAKKQEAASHVAVLEGELAEVKRSIKNLMSAIERGIITDTTKGRLLELEAEQARLTAQIAAGRADIIVIPREDIVAGLTMYRDGDIKDKRYQAKLFDTFLVAVYLYDDDMKIVFSFSGKQNTVRVPLDASVVADIENPSSATGSYVPPSGPPKSKTRLPACLAFLILLLVFKYQTIGKITSVFSMENAPIPDTRLESGHFYIHILLSSVSAHGIPGRIRPQLSGDGTAQLPVEAQIGTFGGPLDLLVLLVLLPALALFVTAEVIIGAVALTGKHNAVLLITKIRPAGKRCIDRYKQALLESVFMIPLTPISFLPFRVKISCSICNAARFSLLRFLRFLSTVLLKFPIILP